jgi:adenylate cyclase
MRVATGVAELDRLGDAMRQMKQALGLFGIYVPRDLVRQLIAQGSELRLGGERRQLTVMFSDVQDFTRIAEGLDPEELMRIASAYFEAVTVELLRNGATIDKYIGDAVMAVWNAPRRDLAHAMHACHAALRVRQVTLTLAEAFTARGWPALRTRFGVHTGQAVVGNLGSSDRMSYSAVGSMVNLASRLEGLNKMYGTQILVSEATLRGAGSAFVARPVDLVTPKGIGDPVEIHELIGLAAARTDGDAPLVADRAMVARLPDWHEMVACYRTRRFEAAAAALARCGTEGDPVAALYATRLAALRAAPPGPGWTPVIGYQEK